MDENRYRQAEQALWAHAGASPVEHRFRLASSGVHVRVQEVGSGPPVLFIHGGPNSGSTWAILAALLPEFRCLIVDRPGTGLSEPLPLSLTTALAFAEGFVVEVLDGLAVERAHLVVSSFGGYIGLRSAAVHPERIDRMVQMGSPPMIPGGTVPLFMRLIMVPGLGRLIGALPPSQGAARMTLKQIGHGASLAAGRIPQVFVDWYVALQRHTDTMRNEIALIGAAGTFFGGFDRVLALDELFLGSVRTPTCFLWGSEEPFAAPGAEEQLVAAMPHAELERFPGAGHLPWLDAPEHAARTIRRFLGAPASAVA
jgi:2-hydroxy-6-oxonona-2,4-dienedioate hydrolase